MSKENHEWVVGEPPPFIRPHSQVKHRILNEYLKRYVATLTANPRRPELRLTVVDGFAGGGVYRDEKTHEDRPGSPLIALESMKAAAQDAQALRSNEFKLDVEYFFVEKKRGAFEYLNDTIHQSEFRHLIGEQIQLLHGEIETYVDRIIDRIKQRRGGQRAIFVLDQFGYVQVPFPMIRRIFSELKNAEIILTFATDFLIDHLTVRPETQLILQKAGLNLTSETIGDYKERPEWRWLIQRDLHKEIHINSGADHYTPFFIRSKDAHRDFWLIHLSGHAKARDVMVDVHWQQNTSFAHYGRPGLNMLGYDPDEDPLITGYLPLPIFQFDAKARHDCVAALGNELPKRIADHRDGIRFKDFFALVTNETPATSELMKDVVRQIAGEGLVEIFDKGGKRRSRVETGTDILKWNPQKRLFMPSDID